MIIIRSAGFLAEMFIQLHEHTGMTIIFPRLDSMTATNTDFTLKPSRFVDDNTVVDAHSDDIPSYRLDNAFPGLLEHTLKLDFDTIDVTEHGHVPYFVILVRALYDWKQAVSPHVSSRFFSYPRSLTSLQI